MANIGRAARWAGARFSRRLARSIPYVGAVVAIATLGATMRRKGMVGGLADTAINSIPFVGAAKNVIEVARREDFFPDLPPSRRGARAHLTNADRAGRGNSGRPQGAKAQP